MSKLVVLEAKQLQKFRKLAVLGDIHGDYKTLKSALHIADPAKDGIIFLGDYADRGPFGIEVIDTIDSLIEKYPRNVFALKGNHEDYEESGKPKFSPWDLEREVEEKRGNWLNYFNKTFKPFVERLHLAIIAPGEMLFVHGGISSRIRGLKDLETPTIEIENDILWSDPMEKNGEINASDDRRGRPKFGPDISKSVCQKIGVKRIIRSHDPVSVTNAGGPYYTHEGRVITTSTTGMITSADRAFVLSISPVDFSIKCLLVDVNSTVESEIVSCRSRW